MHKLFSQLVVRSHSWCWPLPVLEHGVNKFNRKWSNPICFFPSPSISQLVSCVNECVCVYVWIRRGMHWREMGYIKLSWSACSAVFLSGVKMNSQSQPLRLRGRRQECAKATSQGTPSQKLQCPTLVGGQVCLSVCVCVFLCKSCWLLELFESR